jgi:HlyD family secretion protein
MTTDLQKLRIDKSLKAPQQNPRRWPWILALILLAGGSVGFYQYQQANAAVPVEIQRVRAAASPLQNNDAVLLTSAGYIIAAHRIELASKVMGRVAWVGVEMGDKVKKDQVIVRLEDDEYKARVVQNQGQLDSAKARLAELKAGNRPQEIAQAAATVDSAAIELEKARRNYNRLETLAKTAAFSQTELDDARDAAKAAAVRLESTKQQLDLLKAGSRKEQIAAQEGVVAQLKGALDTATLDLTNTVIRATVDATILERNVEVGEFVTNGFVGERGAKGYVVSIADLSDLLVELDISQSKFANVSMKQPCWVVTDAYPDRKYDGVVELIAPVANRQKATVQVRVKITAPDDFLKPDMNARVSFLSPAKLAAAKAAATTTGSVAAAIRIPASAIKDGAVFLVEEGKAVRRPVTTGPADSNGNIEVTQGLSGGEDLIVGPPTTLKEGGKVSVNK